MKNQSIDNLTTLQAICTQLGTTMEKEFPAAAKEVLTDDELAYREKKLITKGINHADNGNKVWEPDWNKTDERKWEAWHWIKADEDTPAGSGFSNSLTLFVFTAAGVGSRLCFKTEAGLKHYLKHFPDIEKRFILIGK